MIRIHEPCVKDAEFLVAELVWRVVFPLRLTGPLDPGVFGLDPGSRAGVVVGRVAAEGAARGGPAEAATVRVGAVASALLGVVSLIVVSGRQAAPS